jgi:hypothetical protein
MREFISGNGFEKNARTLMLAVSDQDREVSETINHGAKVCQVGDAIRDSIYSPFQLASTVRANAESTHGEGRRVFGGRFDANQANAVAKFLKKVVEAPLVHTAADALDVKTSVYVTRMKLEEWGQFSRGGPGPCYRSLC